MPELRSALATEARAGRFGAGSGEPSVVVSERPLGTLIQLSGWRDNFGAAGGAVLQRFGFPGVGEFGRAQVAQDAVAFRIAPERVLVRFASSTFSQKLEGVGVALTPVLDLGHSRTLVAIAGTGAPDLLARLLPIDFDEAGFPPGHFVVSAMHSVAVMVHRLADPPGSVFEVYLPRSLAAALWKVIAESAAPFGYQVRGVAPI
jgi:heterotetrameric sarcosine oxidase gamma subunit